jgi:serine/threonine protein kinase
MKLMDGGVSEEMLFSSQSRCLICFKSVRMPLEHEDINSPRVVDAYTFLHDLHKVTGNIHRDIYHRNILCSVNGKVSLNDFGSSAPEKENSPIEGNIYFASDAVLMSKNNEHVYHVSDDIYSLTFTFIYLLFPKKFSSLFEVSTFNEISKKRKLIINNMDLKCKNLIISALQFSSDSDYDNARDCIIKLLKAARS